MASPLGVRVASSDDVNLVALAHRFIDSQNMGQEFSEVRLSRDQVNQLANIVLQSGRGTAHHIRRLCGLFKDITSQEKERYAGSLNPSSMKKVKREASQGHMHAGEVVPATSPDVASERPMRLKITTPEQLDLLEEGGLVQNLEIDLDFSEYKNVDNKILQVFSERCGNQLRELRLPAVDEQVDLEGCRFSKLEVVHIPITTITEDNLQNLMNAAPNIETITMHRAPEPRVQDLPFQTLRRVPINYGPGTRGSKQLG